MSFQDQVNKKNMAYFGATSYFVQIIPKNSASFDRCFTPSDKSTGKEMPQKIIKFVKLMEEVFTPW